MEIVKHDIPGLLVVIPDVFGDTRGFFYESWSQGRYQESGIPGPFVQDNFSRSSQGVLRGLHFQNPNPQGKLVSVLEGEVHDVVVDIRRGSPTFGKWAGVRLSSQDKKQFFVPPGFAHGFEVLSTNALFHYKCTDLYYPEYESTLFWDDPDLGIEWLTQAPNLSAKDKAGLRLKDLPEEKLFKFEG
jgi:dTDP-4-dehydrorhamnose 3,5-epimerase